MITNISLVTVWCMDQDKARDFYGTRSALER